MRQWSAAEVGNFKKDLAVYTDSMLPAQMKRFAQALAMHVLRGVMQKTPVGNPSLWKGKAPKNYVGGHARMNWQVSLSQPKGGTLAGQDPAGGYAVLAGMAEITMAQPYQQIWIVNNVPYILVLENGRAPDAKGVMRGSTQAPHGMLGVTMEEVRRDFGAK